MLKVVHIIDKLQSDWPLIPSLALAQCADVPPWTMRSAQQLQVRLSPMERIICRQQLPDLVAFLAHLQRRWIITIVLSALLALAIIGKAQPMAPDTIQTGILLTVLSTVLLPPLAIYHGIARDYVAARSLLAVIRASAQ